MVDTEEAAAKRREAAARQQAQREASTIRVGPWRVYRFDTMNVALEKDDWSEDQRLYYSTYVQALCSLLERHAEHHSRSTLVSFVSALAAAKQEIVDALKGMQLP